MGRGFTEEERLRIRGKLVTHGRELFTKFGLEKTRVEELAREAGIAKGTFYRFFPSKEALFAEILLEETPRMVNELVAKSFGVAQDVREALVLFMKELVRLIETDQLIRAIASVGDAQARVLGMLDNRKLQSSRVEMLFPLAEAIAGAQRRGQIVEGDPLEIAQLLGVIKLLPLYKERVPAAQYWQLVNRSAEVIADGLTCPARAQMRS